MKLFWVALALALVIVACGGRSKRGLSSTASVPRTQTAGERMLSLLPQGAQLVVELDLARLRANPVVGAVVTRALEAGAMSALPAGVAAPPMASAELVVLASYGLGTAEAATVVIIASKQVAEGVRLGEGVYAFGPADWVSQIEARAALLETGGESKLAVPADLLALRDRAMPHDAPGASLRITARLPFDARVALARITGLENAPAQLSVWADVVDDLAIIVDADALDPGDKATKKSTARLVTMIRGALTVLAADPTARALGLPPSIAGAKLVARGTWVRTIFAIGPKHLARVIERADALLQPAKEGS